MSLPPGNGFVEIQKDAGHDGPGRVLRGVERLVTLGFTDGEQLFGFFHVAFVDGEFFVVAIEQDL